MRLLILIFFILTVNSVIANDLFNQLVEKYEDLEEFNSLNETQNNRHLNQYIIELNPGWIEERPEVNIIKNNHDRLSQTLKTFNENRKDNTRFYVVLVNDYKALLREKIDVTQLPGTVENLSQLIKLPDANQDYERFKRELLSLPAQLSELMSKKGYDERVIYFYGQVNLYKLSGDYKQYRFDNLLVQGELLEQVKSFIKSNAKSGLTQADIESFRVEKIINNIISSLNNAFEGEPDNSELIDCIFSNDQMAELTKEIKESEYENEISSFASLLKNKYPYYKSSYFIVDKNTSVNEEELFTSEIIPDKLSSLAKSNLQYKVYLILKEINFMIPKSEWVNFSKNVAEKSGIAQQNGNIIITIPYYKSNCSEGKSLFKKEFGLFMPSVYCSDQTLNLKMNSAIALDGISWENAFNQAFKLIPKPHISYHFRFLFNGDIIYDGKKEEYGEGFANINDVVIWEDKRFDRLQEANLYYTTTNTALSPEAAMNNLENYQQKVDEIMSEPPDFQLLKNTNLKLGIVDEPMAKEFARYFSKYKHTSTLSLLSKPESDYFYGGINYLEVDGYLNLIDGASAVAGFFGADFIFDGIGAYYAYENKRYVEAAFYTAAIAIPLMNGATRKALMDGSAYLLKTLNGKYVVVPRNVLGMNYMFRVEQAFSQFSRTALNVKSFNRAARYKTSKQFVSALEEGLLARADNIKRINDNPSLVDGFYNYHTAGKGSLDNFLQESDEVIRIFSNFKRLKDLPDNVLARVKNWDDDVLKQLDDDLADQVFRQSLDEELVEAWEMAFKHADLRTKTTALSRLNDIAGRGRGIDKAKLTDALNGDLGDVLNKATGDDLTGILNRLDAEHVTGSHLDEITNRLKTYPELKTDLLDNPGWFETFDDILQDPGRYWDISKNADIPRNSAISKWGNGKWFKEITEAGRQFEADILLSLRNRAGKAYSELKSFVSSKLSKNLDDYTLLSQVRLKTKNGSMIADQVYVKKIYNADLDEYFLDMNEVIILENKLKESTSFTTRQVEGMQGIATNGKIEVNTAISSFENLILNKGDELISPTVIKLDGGNAGDMNSLQIDFVNLSLY